MTDVSIKSKIIKFKLDDFYEVVRQNVQKEKRLRPDGSIIKINLCMPSKEDAYEFLEILNKDGFNTVKGEDLAAEMQLDKHKVVIAIKYMEETV